MEGNGAISLLDTRRAVKDHTRPVPTPQELVRQFRPLAQIARQTSQTNVINRVCPAPANRDDVINRFLERTISSDLTAAPKATTALRFAQLLHILHGMPLLPRLDPGLPFTVKLAKTISIGRPPFLVLTSPLRRPCPSAIFLTQFL
jgi:hypothetical protein